MIFISWQPYCSRSDNIAREFSGKSFMVYFGFLGSKYSTIIFKYLLQSLKTFRILFKYRPDVVFVMSPPLFASIPVLIYCAFFKKKYVIDAHTGAFIDKRWKKVLFLQKFLCRNAKFTIVTNTNLNKIVKKWGGNSVIVPDVPIKFKNFEDVNLKGTINIIFVSSYDWDEPLEEFLYATKYFKKVTFYVTGKIDKKSKRMNNCFKIADKNVIFTDFLPYQKYYGLLLKSTLVVALTKIDNTMQRGAYEAIYLGKPIITSNWDILKKNFKDSAIYVDSTIGSIRKGLNDALSSIQSITKQAQYMKKQKEIIWRVNKKIIMNMLKEDGKKKEWSS